MLDVEVRQPGFSELIDEAGELARVAAGFDFTEGPVWHPGCQSLIFSDILGNSIYGWRADSGAQVRKRNSYMANGNAYDHQGRLITCEHATSRLTRTDLTTGTYETLASHFQGKELNSPNDVVVKSDGAIYFTDPTSGRSEGYGVPREPELSFSGVYRLVPGESEPALLMDDFEKPNGLCFSLDERKLFINDTARFHIRVFDVLEDGTLENGQLWAETSGEGIGAPDGMKIDSQGNVYCCGPGGIHLFNRDATSLGVIRMPEHTTNFCFGGADLRDLYITASTSVYHIRVEAPGHPTFEG